MRKGFTNDVEMLIKNPFHLLENSGAVPQKGKYELPKDAAIPHTGIFPKELKTGVQTDSSTIHISQKVKTNHGMLFIQKKNGVLIHVTA